MIMNLTEIRMTQWHSPSQNETMNRLLVRYFCNFLCWRRHCILRTGMRTCFVATGTIIRACQSRHWCVFFVALSIVIILNEHLLSSFDIYKYQFQREDTNEDTSVLRLKGKAKEMIFFASDLLPMVKAVFTLPMHHGFGPVVCDESSARCCWRVTSWVVQCSAMVYRAWATLERDWRALVLQSGVRHKIMDQGY